MDNSDIKRNTVFIEKNFQMRSIATVVSIIMASGLLSGALLYLMLSSELSSELQVAHNQIKNTWDSLAPAIIFGNILTVVVTGFVAGIAVLYQSHKIAGPMYRLQMICNEVSQGNYEPVTSLRKADQLTALAKSFEQMVESLQTKHKKNESLINDMDNILNSAMEKTSDKNQQALLVELKNKLDKVKSTE